MQAEKEHVALVSIAASAALTVAKAIVGFTTGSLAILSEAGHSLIDLGATVMTYVAVRISGKPADEEHHYGHGKVEAVSALAETALLFLLSGIVIWEAVNRLTANSGHGGTWDFVLARHAETSAGPGQFLCTLCIRRARRRQMVFPAGDHSAPRNARKGTQFDHALCVLVRQSEQDSRTDRRICTRQCDAI